MQDEVQTKQPEEGPEQEDHSDEVQPDITKNPRIPHTDGDEGKFNQES